VHSVNANQSINQSINHSINQSVNQRPDLTTFTCSPHTLDCRLSSSKHERHPQEQPTVPTVGGAEIAQMLEEALKKKQKKDKRKSSSDRRRSSTSKRSSVKRTPATATSSASASTSSALPIGATVKGTGAGARIKASGPGMPAEKFDPKATTSGDAFFAQFKSKQDKSYGPRYHG
jgi:hypothetical protein